MINEELLNNEPMKIFWISLMASIRNCGQYRQRRVALLLNYEMMNNWMLKRISAPIFHKNTWKMYFLWMWLVSTWFYFDVFTVWVFKKIGDFVELGTTEPIKSLLITYGVIFILFYIWKFLIRKKAYATARYELAKHLWAEYIQKFFGLDYTYSEKIWTGRIIDIMQTWINSWLDIWMVFLTQIPNLIVKLWFTLVLLYFIWPIYLVIFVVAFVLLQRYVMWINKTYTSPLRRKRKEASVQGTRSFVRVLMSKQEVTQSWKEHYEIDKYCDLIDQQKMINFRITKYIYFMFNVPIITAQCVSICVMVYAYVSLRDGTFSLWLFSALLWMTWFLTQLMITSTDTFKKVMDRYTHVEKLRKLFDEAPETRNTTAWSVFAYKNWSIAIKNMSFWYEWWKPVFTNFSLDIEWGQKVALVGMSGAWKSTLVKLIAWYLEPNIWSISVDEQDLDSVALQSYFASVWFLTQEPNVFDWTIRENMVYSVGPWTEADQLLLEKSITAALKSANCEFVFDLPDWIDTEIGERGVRLSGWQRQRLAIAKIFLKDPQIIILDEPTSALDSFSEESITQAMHSLFEWRTVLIIAHRLQTVKEADLIVVLWYDEEKQSSIIIEQWTHTELVEKEWFYATMLEVQTGF